MWQVGWQLHLVVSCTMVRSAVTGVLFLKDRDLPGPQLICAKKNPSRLAWISCHGSIFNSFYSIAEHKHTIQIGKQLLGRTVMITQHDLVVIRHSPP